MMNVLDELDLRVGFREMGSNSVLQLCEMLQEE